MPFISKIILIHNAKIIQVTNAFILKRITHIQGIFDTHREIRMFPCIILPFFILRHLRHKMHEKRKLSLSKHILDS